ncbi:copper chaperone for superoxide dismutase isoform X2 [Balearica regulorum gibbericeps]|uniref:copper chaperone for superoxide dismutase isoform X2 n=1 Tax=Balearica regulorum gibbericeps TaxID=100784 RepID=UPI003F62A317
MATAGPTGSSCRLEFAVQMRCQGCAEAVRAALEGAPGVRLLELRLEAQTVLVETTAAAERVRELLEKSGRRAVLKGMGGSDDASLGAAVAALSGPGAVRGLVRFLQVSPTRCLVDGAIDGLPPGPHGLHVHEFGDLSRPCDSCGGHFNPDGECHGGPQDQHRHVGDLGNIWADAEGRASFRMEDSRLKAGLWRGGPRSRALPEPQACLFLRRPDPLGGAGPDHGDPQPHGDRRPHCDPRPYGGPGPPPLGASPGE